jgi:hypothetical protein
VSLPVEYEITPEPSDEERAAILAALADPAPEKLQTGPWSEPEA